MAQHDFNIANQLFPATRADLNNAFVALASNSSGDAEPGTTYANQWWYETDTNTLKLRNEANSAWIEIATLDQSSNNVLSITTQGITLGATAITASGTEINLLDDLTRGSLIYGNASGVTSELVKGAAATVLTSDGTDISWAATSTGASEVIFPSDWGSPTNTYTSSGTWSKGSLADDDYVWIYLIGGGGGGGSMKDDLVAADIVNGGDGGSPLFLYGKAKVFDGGTYVVAAQKAGNTPPNAPTKYLGTTPNHTTFTLSSANGSMVYTTNVSADTTSSRFFTVFADVIEVVDLASFPDYTLKSRQTENTDYSDTGLPSGVSYRYLAPGKTYNDPVAAAEHCIFGGGNGGGSTDTSSKLAGTSEFCGAGGANAAQGVDGTAPGGGGGGSETSTNSGGSGAQGEVRTYHV